MGTPRAENLQTARAQLYAGQHPVDAMVLEGDLRLVLGDLLSGDTCGLVVMGRDRRHSGAVASDLLRVSTSLVVVA